MFLFIILNLYTWQLIGQKKLDLETFKSKIKQFDQIFVHFFVDFTSWARNHYGHVIIMETCSLWARSHYFWRHWYPELYDTFKCAIFFFLNIFVPFLIAGSASHWLFFQVLSSF